MAKIRVHEMARELGMTNREVMDTLKSLGIDVKSHMSSVEDTLAKRVREKYEIIRKEQKVEAPNNEKNVNKQEETPSAEEETDGRDKEEIRIPTARHPRHPGIRRRELLRIRK